MNITDQAEYGLTIVEGMNQQGLLKPLMSRIGVTKLTHYGAEFDVKAKQVLANFTNNLLKLISG